MLYDYFKNGINIGGWLSQYDCLPKVPETEEELNRHFESYMTEQNFKQIASWGIDHVRLPVDYRVLEDKGNPFIMKEDAFRHMKDCADWCEKHHLNLIIDLHNAEGNLYGAMEEPMPLLADETLRLRFLNIWKNIALYFKGRKNPVIMFELLNEVSDGSGYLWNRLCERAVSSIREIDSDRYILIGSNEANSAFRLKELSLYEDPNIFYNFHFYDPQVFTHQKAHFSDEMRDFDQNITYPGDISDFTGFLLKNKQFIPKHNRVAMENYLNKDLTKKLLKDAFDFVKYSGRELYCGEFGAINTAPVKDAAAWLKDCMELFDEHRIGHAVWNYKEMDFGFVNTANEVISEELLEEVFIKVLQ